MAFPSVGELLLHKFNDLLADGSLRMTTWMGEIGDWLNAQAGGGAGQALVKNSDTDGDFSYVDLAPLSDDVPQRGVTNGLPGIGAEASRSDHQHPPFSFGPVTGSRGGNAALTSLLAALNNVGAIQDQTTA